MTLQSLTEMALWKTLFFSPPSLFARACFQKLTFFPLCLKLKNQLAYFIFYFLLGAGHALCVTCSWPTETEAQPLFLLAQGWVPHVGGTTQQEVIPGSGIAKNILLAQEVVSDYHKEKGKARCTLKVDLIKAYDFLS
jgi:hypothetical protein